MIKNLSLLIAVVFSSYACAPSTHQVLATGESQVKLRSIQTRAFETTDREKTLRTTIATLQDLGFVVDRADGVLGTVSATKLDGWGLLLSGSFRSR